MTPGKINLTVYQGASYRKKFIWRGRNRKPINLTGYSARMHVRLNHGADEILLDLNTDNGGIVITPLTGTFEIVLSRDQILALNFKSAVFDILFFAPDGFTVIRRIEGKFTISPGATL